jgi:hypothetical protein
MLPSFRLVDRRSGEETMSTGACAYYHRALEGMLRKLGTEMRARMHLHARLIVRVRRRPYWENPWLRRSSAHSSASLSPRVRSMTQRHRRRQHRRWALEKLNAAEPVAVVAPATQ